jgi:large subunit ribosomal protein L17
MRHGVSGRKLGRTASHRTALFKNMATSLLEHGRIRTTICKAKEIKKYADKLITLGKQNTLHAKRLAYARLGNNQKAHLAVQKLFDVIAPAFKGRDGGYTRIYRIGTRRGDGTEMAYVEYLNEALAPATTEEGAAKKGAKASVKKAAAKKVAAPKTEKAAASSKNDATPKAKKAKAKKAD